MRAADQRVRTTAQRGRVVRTVTAPGPAARRGAPDPQGGGEARPVRGLHGDVGLADRRGTVILDGFRLSAPIAV